MLTRIRQRLLRVGPEAGFTLVEVMVVVLIIAVASFALIDSLVAAGRLTHRSQRHEQAIVLAQSKIEKIRSYPWSSIGLSSLPTHTDTGNTAAGDNNPTNPDYYVTGSQFQVMSNFRDSTSTVLGTESLVSGGSVPATETFSKPTGLTGLSGISGTIHYYVTQVPGLTATNPLGGTVGTLSGANERRITVAVVLTGEQGVGPTKPIWVTSTISNPQTCPLGLVLQVVPAGLSC